MMASKSPKIRRALRMSGAAVGGLLMLAGARSALLRADFLRYNPPPFDFSDDFYRINGIDPTQIPMRVGNPDRPQEHWALDSSNTDPTRREVRVKETTGGFDKDGHLIYYSIMGIIRPFTFTNDAAGAHAREIADNFRAFIFPKTPRNPDGSPGAVIQDPGPPNRRQDNLFETKTGYLCENLLGLWVVEFVVYTRAALTTSAGQMTLANLAARHGTDLDGTPVIKRLQEIKDLQAAGFVELRENSDTALTGPPRWVI